MMKLFERSVLAALVGLALVCGPVRAEEADSWAALDPKLTGLAKRMWDFAEVRPYLGEIPRVDSVEAVDGYGYFLDLPNGFLHAASWDGPCGCGDRASVSAFKKNDGGYLLVKSAVYSTCNKFPLAAASEPVAEVLPPGFSLADFYRPGQKMRTDRAFFQLVAALPEKGPEMTLTLRPLMNLTLPYHPDRLLDTLAGQEVDPDSGVDGMAVQNIAFFSHEFKAAHSENRLADRFLTQVEFSPEDLRALAADVLGRRNGQPVDPDEVEERAKSLEHLYEVYQEYLKVGFSDIVLEWSRAQNRFQVKGKIPIKPLPFIEFVMEGLYWEISC